MKTFVYSTKTKSFGLVDDLPKDDYIRLPEFKEPLPLNDDDKSLWEYYKERVNNLRDSRDRTNRNDPMHREFDYALMKAVARLIRFEIQHASDEDKAFYKDEFDETLSKIRNFLRTATIENYDTKSFSEIKYKIIWYLEGYECNVFRVIKESELDAYINKLHDPEDYSVCSLHVSNDTYIDKSEAKSNRDELKSLFNKSGYDGVRNKMKQIR